MIYAFAQYTYAAGIIFPYQSNYGKKLLYEFIKMRIGDPVALGYHQHIGDDGTEEKSVKLSNMVGDQNIFSVREITHIDQFYVKDTA